MKKKRIRATLPVSAATHAAYVAILALFAERPRLRTAAIAEKLPDEKRALTWARLHQLERLGCLVRVGDPEHWNGGRLLALGPTSLPAFDDRAARAVYERARACFALLAAAGEAGMRCPDLHAACDEAVTLAVTASRLLAWERAGKVRCDRTVYPHRWFALRDGLPDFDAMVAGEDARRRNQAQPKHGGPVRNWVVGLVPPKPKLRRILDALPQSPMMGA